MTDISVEVRTGLASGLSGEDADPTFGDLFHAHYGALVRLAGLLGADDPEDVAQDAFARFYRRRRRLRDDNAAFAYLRSTVCNLTRNRKRHLRIARLRLPSIRDRAGPDHEMPAELTAIVQEDRRRLIAALDGLPPRQREVLVLRYWLDLSEREIAETMGVSVGTVKSHAHRGIAALKRHLGEES